MKLKQSEKLYRTQSCNASTEGGDGVGASTQQKDITFIKQMIRETRKAFIL